LARVYDPARWLDAGKTSEKEGEASDRKRKTRELSVGTKKPCVAKQPSEEE